MCDENVLMEVVLIVRDEMSWVGDMGIEWGEGVCRWENDGVWVG